MDNLVNEQILLTIRVIIKFPAMQKKFNSHCGWFR